MIRRALLKAVAASAELLLALPAAAQDWPQ
jgi:hypothetical protein